MSEESGITIVQIPFPEGGDPICGSLVGPAKLRIAPGDGADWVNGTHHDPSHRVPCRVATDGAKARISQESRWRGSDAANPGLRSATRQSPAVPADDRIRRDQRQRLRPRRLP